VASTSFTLPDCSLSSFPRYHACSIAIMRALIASTVRQTFVQVDSHLFIVGLKHTLIHSC